MKEIIIQVQKQGNNFPDCNHIDCDGYNLGCITGTVKMGTEQFDIDHKIAYFDNHGHFAGLLWNVVKIEDYIPQEVKV